MGDWILELVESEDGILPELEGGFGFRYDQDTKTLYKFCFIAIREDKTIMGFGHSKLDAFDEMALNIREYEDEQFRTGMEDSGQV